MVAAPRHEPPPAERPLPAWLFSLVFHGGTLLLLSMVLDAPPRGAAEEPGRTTGIVLKRASEEGPQYEGEDAAADSTDTANLSPADLAAALPSETDAPDLTGDLPEQPTAWVGTPAAGGQPNAGEFLRGSPGGGRPAAGGEATVRVFGVEGHGTKFVYLFDRSTSMEGSPLSAAKQELLQSLDALQSIHQFQIIFFNHRVRTFDLTGGGNRIAFATERNKRLAGKFVGGITADGGTDRLSALEAAIDFRPDVIFFLTDADSPMPPSELARIAQRNRRVGATIATIEFGQGPRRHSTNFLVRLAQQTGGQYGYVDTLRLRE